MHDAECTSIGTLLAVLNAMVARDDLEFSEAPHRMSGGYSADLFGFRLRNAPSALDGALVLRLMRSDRDAARETVIQRTVAELGFPAPHIRLSCDSMNELGRPFVVMDHVSGTYPISVSGPYSAWRAFQRLPVILANVMSALHSLDAGVVCRELIASGFSAEQLGADAALAEIANRLSSLASGGPAALEWLRRHGPASLDLAVICHGDLHAFNILATKGEITGVVDWELATVGDAALDLARTMMILSFVPGPMSAAVRPAIQALGRRSARQFLSAYARVHEVDEVSLRWHEALHCLRLLSIVATCRVDGTFSPVAGLWEPLAPGLARRLEQLTGVSVTIPGSAA